MNDIFDKLLIRFLFTVFICLALVFYKYLHVLLYPTNKKRILKPIYPIDNPADTLHIFGRLAGITLILSALEFNEYNGFFLSSFHFFVWGVLGMIVYLISIYITESIIFYNFEYVDEVLKKKNMAYSSICFSNAITLALIIKTIFKEAESSLILMIILWLFSLVLYGFGTKLFQYVSKLKFNPLVIQQKISIGISYSGFLFGLAIIIIASFSHEHREILSYIVQVLLKTILGIIILPLFRIGFKLIFRVQEDLTPTSQSLANKTSEDEQLAGYGIYEGSLYLSSALLTAIIIGQIHFGTIYPFF